MRINPFTTTLNLLNLQQNRQACFFKHNNLSPLKQDTVSFGAMKKQEFSGIDRVCVDKFKAPIEKFNTNEDLQDWAGEKLQTILTTDYEGRREETQIQRKALIKEWGDYLTKENDAYNKTAGLLVMSAITKDLEPNNDELPPCLNKGVLADVMSKVDNGENVNILKEYKTGLRHQYFDETKTVGTGKEWIEIPSKEHDPENFEKNVDKLKTLSHKNWCTHSFNAEPYLSEGDFHILLDNGKPRLGVRFYEDTIAEIQGVQNNSQIPLEYFEDAKEHVEKNNYELDYRAIDEFEDAEIKKEECEEAKKVLQPAIEKNDFPKILDYFHIKSKEDKDGFYTISHYDLKHTGRGIKPADLGVNEDAMFAKIKRIEGKMNLEGSKLTDTGELESIGGYTTIPNCELKSLGKIKHIKDGLDISNSQLTDLGDLEKVYGSFKAEMSGLKSLGKLKYISGHADFRDSQITDLGELEYIGGNANFNYSPIEDLGNLKFIGGKATFNDKIKSLKNLERIEGSADFTDSVIEDLGNLKYIGFNAIFSKDATKQFNSIFAPHNPESFKKEPEQKYKKPTAKHLKNLKVKSFRIKGSKLRRSDFFNVKIDGQLIAD